MAIERIIDKRIHDLGGGFEVGRLLPFVKRRMVGPYIFFDHMGPVELAPGIPRELDEAAWVDGASRLYTLRRVILPLAMPGIVVVAIMTFIGAYAQQFIFALTFNSKTEFMPLPVGLFAFFGKQEVIWNELMAASFVGILPVMIVIVFLQRYLVAGLTAGAVKQ